MLQPSFPDRNLKLRPENVKVIKSIFIEPQSNNPSLENCREKTATVHQCQDCTTVMPFDLLLYVLPLSQHSEHLPEFLLIIANRHTETFSEGDKMALLYIDM